MQVAFLIVLVVLVAMLLHLLDRIKFLERRAERQTEMLVALLQRSGINPVTLD